MDNNNIYYAFKETPIGRLLRISKNKKIVCSRTSQGLVDRLAIDGLTMDQYDIGKGMPKECTKDDIEFVEEDS